MNTYLTWFKAHERFLLFVLAAALVCYVWGSALNAWVDHDKRIATVSDTANKQAQDALALATKNTDARLNARIDSMMHQRVIDTQRQKQIDQAAQVTQVGARIAQLLKVKPEDVTASPANNTLTLARAAAHEDVASLEDLQGGECRCTHDLQQHEV